MTQATTNLDPKAIAKQLTDFVTGEGTETRAGLIQRIKELETKAGERVDLSSVLEEVDRLKAAQEQMREKIRTSKSGFYVPGVEEMPFNFAKTCLGIKVGGGRARKDVFDRIGAGHEHEVLCATEKMRERVLGKTMAVGDDESMGAMVPDQVLPDVIAKLYARSVFFDETGDTPNKISILDGMAGNGIVTMRKFKGGFVAYWVDEAEEIATSYATVGTVNFTPHKLGIATELTEELIADAGPGFDALWRNDMSRVAALKLDDSIAFGTGGGSQPRGIFHHPDVRVYRAETNTVITQTAAAAVSDFDGGEVTFDGLDTIDTALEDSNVMKDSSFWTIGPGRLFTRMKQLKVLNYDSQSSGQPYLLGMPMLRDEGLAEIIGQFDRSTQFPSNQLPGASIHGATDSTNEKYGPFLRGNLSQAVWGRWAGIEISDDSGIGTGFLAGKTTIKLTLRGDLQMRRGEEIIVCADARMRT